MKTFGRLSSSTCATSPAARRKLIGVGDRAEALCGDPDERELGAVEQIEDDHVLGPHAVRVEAGGQPAGVLPQLARRSSGGRSAGSCSAGREAKRRLLRLTPAR